MRPGQNKRMRGRNSNNNRKGPNPLTRSYESNGPDVKIRGTAHHIGEKYLQLARDAQSSGDPVMAESYLQHAEHYFRLIAAAQQAQQQAQFGYQRQPGDQQDSDDDDGDEDFAALPDRFASPSERSVQPPQSAPQPYADRQPYSDRQDQGRPDHQRQDQQRPDHQRQSGQPNYDRPQGDRQPYEARDRQYDNRRGSYQDRNQDRGGQDRGAQDRGAQDRNNQDRTSQDRGGYERAGQDRGNYERNGQDRNGQDRSADRPPREYDNRNFRNRNREFRDQPRDPREPRPAVVEEPTNGLPAFITGPSGRPNSEDDPQPETSVAPTEATEDTGAHMRPRRRRRPKPEFADGESNHSEGEDAPASDPVGD